jgi:hypothetical protein
MEHSVAFCVGLTDCVPFRALFIKLQQTVTYYEIYSIREVCHVIALAIIA